MATEGLRVSFGDGVDAGEVGANGFCHPFWVGNGSEGAVSRGIPDSTPGYCLSTPSGCRACERGTSRSAAFCQWGA
jgi:hypothetical protein